MRDSFWIYHTTHWLLSSTTYLEEITFVCRVVCIYSEQEKYMHTGNIHLKEFGKMNSNVSQCHSGNDCSGITTTLQTEPRGIFWGSREGLLFCQATCSYETYIVCMNIPYRHFFLLLLYIAASYSNEYPTTKPNCISRLTKWRKYVLCESK